MIISEQTHARHSPFPPWGLAISVAYFCHENKQKSVQINLEKRQLLSFGVRPGYEHRQGETPSREEAEQRVLTQSLSLRELSSELQCRTSKDLPVNTAGILWDIMERKKAGSMHKNTWK